MKKLIFFLAVALISTTLSAQKKTTEIKVSQLPQSTQKYIKDNLPGCQIVRAIKVVENGKVTYNVGVDVKGKKNLFIFDEAGTFLKRGEKEEVKSTDSIVNKKSPKKSVTNAPDQPKK